MALPDRVNGGKIKDVESERGELWQALLGLGERAMPCRIGRLRSGEELVPGRERRLLDVHDDLEHAIEPCNLERVALYLQLEQELLREGEGEAFLEPALCIGKPSARVQQALLLLTLDEVGVSREDARSSSSSGRTSWPAPTRFSRSWRQVPRWSGEASIQ